MITDTVVEAMDLMIELCMDEDQEKGMTRMREMLCELDVDSWIMMSAAEKTAWMRGKLNPNLKRKPLFGVRYVDQSGADEVTYFHSEEAAEKNIWEELELVRDNFGLSDTVDTGKKVEIDQIGTDRWSVWERNWR